CWPPKRSPSPADAARAAHTPGARSVLKTIDDFNFTYQSSLRLHMLGSALTPDFVTDGRTLIFWGKPGRGKTHLAIAIAYRAIQNGFDAFFTTAAALIDDLSAAFAPANSPTHSPRIRILPSSSWTKLAISPTARMPPICSSTSSTSATVGTGR